MDFHTADNAERPAVLIVDNGNELAALGIQDEDLASEIVNAVNSQAELWEALRFVLEELDPNVAIEQVVGNEPYDNRRDRRAYLLRQLKRARAALAKARGE